MKAYIYSYWSSFKKTILDLNNPIIISIATLREKTKDDIFVFDYGKSDWEDYDKILNIKVIKKKPIEINGFSEFQKNVFSRNFDIMKFSKNSKYKTFISVDSDIFWMSGVEEIDYDKFNIRCGNNIGFNNGCYCFTKNSKGMIFIEKFINNLEKCITNKKFQDIIKNKYKFLNDETICRFTYEENKELCTEDIFLYNGSLFDIDIESKWIIGSGNIHIVHGKLREKIPNPFFNKKCGLIGFLIEEIDSSIKSQLPNYYNKIFKKNITTFKFEKLIKDGSKDLLKEFYKICSINNKILI